MLDLSKQDEINNFFDDYNESEKKRLKMLIEEFPFDNLTYNGLETFDIKPVLSKSESVIITNIRDTKKNNNNKTLF